MVQGAHTHTQSVSDFNKLARLINKLNNKRMSQRDYLAHKVMIKLLLADTLEEYLEIRANTRKDVKDRVFELANTVYPEVFRKMSYLSRLSRSNKHRIHFLGDCLTH